MTLSTARQALADAATAAGYRAYTDLTKLVPPCVAVWVPSSVTRTAFANVRDYVFPVMLIADAGTTKADVDWIDTAIGAVVTALEGSHAGDFVSVDPDSPIAFTSLDRVGDDKRPREFMACTLTVVVGGG